jgi:hypothetical protein
LDKRLRENDDAAEVEQIRLIAGAANKAMDRMIQKLDEAHASLTHLRKRGSSPK